MSDPKTPQAGAGSPGAAGSATVLKCDHVRWGMNAILATPMVAIVCGVAESLPGFRFTAGCIFGVWCSMWLVVVWACLKRRQSPNAPASATEGRP